MPERRLLPDERSRRPETSRMNNGPDDVTRARVTNGYADTRRPLQETTTKASGSEAPYSMRSIVTYALNIQ